MSNSSSGQIANPRPEASNSEEFRARTIDLFRQKYGPSFNRVLKNLHRQSFFFDSIDEAHRIQLRPDLLFRQCMPYFATWRAYGCGRPLDEDVLKCMLMAHTLTLTHLDYHLDGASPDQRNTATAVKMSAESAVSYAVRLAYRSSSELAALPTGSRLLREVVDPVSGFVVERMHEDWTGRYSIPDSCDLDHLISSYLESPNSRLLGSGYWEVMIVAGHISCRPEARVPNKLIAFSRSLRRLRQLVDELDDWREDLESGLLTLPTLLRMRRDPVFEEDLRRAWRSGSYFENCSLDPISDDVAEEMGRLIEREGRRAKVCLAGVGNNEELMALVEMKLAKARGIGYKGHVRGPDSDAERG